MEHLEVSKITLFHINIYFVMLRNNYYSSLLGLVSQLFHWAGYKVPCITNNKYFTWKLVSDSNTFMFSC